MIKVEGHPNLYRDENSGAIINCDSTAYNQYVNSISKQEFRKKELDDMRKDINEIKSLLKELLNK
jgi:hypothetical protein